MWPTAHKLLLERRLRKIYGQIRGSVLVVGAGLEPYRELLKSADQVVATDIGEGHGGLDCVADAHSLPFRSESFDFVLAIEVFEHLRAPARAALEISRVLKPNGGAIVTIPFMFRVHGDPNDFQRLTSRGIEAMFGDLFSIDVQPFGGRIHVISDVVSTAWKPLVILRGINWLLSAPLLDRASADCPSGYCVSAIKTSCVRGRKE